MATTQGLTWRFWKGSRVTDLLSLRVHPQSALLPEVRRQSPSIVILRALYDYQCVHNDLMKRFVSLAENLLIPGQELPTDFEVEFAQPVQDETAHILRIGTSVPIDRLNAFSALETRERGGPDVLPPEKCCGR